MSDALREGIRFIAYREHPAPRTGLLADAAVLVLHYPPDDGCVVYAWDVKGHFLEAKTFENDMQANRYVHRYGDEEHDRDFFAPDWKWPFTGWYYLPPIDDIGAFIAVEAQRGHPETQHRCACCGYKTIVELGNYETCRVCYWEEDGETDPETISGPNHITLADARDNLRRFGACKPERKDNVRRPRPHEL